MREKKPKCLTDWSSRLWQLQIFSFYRFHLILVIRDLEILPLTSLSAWKNHSNIRENQDGRVSPPLVLDLFKNVHSLESVCVSAYCQTLQEHAWKTIFLISPAEVTLRLNPINMCLEDTHLGMEVGAATFLLWSGSLTCQTSSPTPQTSCLDKCHVPLLTCKK